MKKTINFRKGILLGLFLLMTIFRALKIFGIRGVDCKSNWLAPVSCQWGNTVLEILLWIVVLVLFFLELYWDHDFKDFLLFCRSFWPIFIFILLAAFSLFWSILFLVTLYKVFVLFTSTILAIYFGRLLGEKRILNVLTWFFTGICVASIGLILLVPKAGIMMEPFYKLAWNGIFWHRNYLGCFMALAIVIFLLQILDWKKLSRIGKSVNSLMILVALFLLVKSKSATGLFTALILVVVCLVLAGWLRFGKRLKPIHYYLILGVAIVAIILVFLNLNAIFNLVGRDTSLTGRVPMWNYLLKNVISQRPVLGYGYGAIWNLRGFRSDLGFILNWGAQVLIGDNGFLDIWLHLGVVGLISLVGLIVLGFIRAIKYLFNERTLVSVFPVVILIFVLVANISLSLILESETFVWAIVVASQVAISITPSRLVS
jgi:O-antigen ligase